MRFLNKNDKSAIRYNSNIVIENIPIEAYQYQVGDRSAIEWVMDRQSIKIDRDSKIINDPNDYANDRMNNHLYPLDLLKKIITLSVETINIIKLFPSLKL